MLPTQDCDGASDVVRILTTSPSFSIQARKHASRAVCSLSVQTKPLTEAESENAQLDRVKMQLDF